MFDQKLQWPSVLECCKVDQTSLRPIYKDFIGTEGFGAECHRQDREGGNFLQTTKNVTVGLFSGHIENKTNIFSFLK